MAAAGHGPRRSVVAELGPANQRGSNLLLLDQAAGEAKRPLSSASPLAFMDEVVPPPEDVEDQPAGTR